MIIIAGTIEVDADKRDPCVVASTPIQQATRDDEPGCLAYCFSADPAVPERIQVYELWTDQESLAAHFAHPNYFAMRKMFADYGPLKAHNLKYRIDASEPVYDPSHTPRADFFTLTNEGPQ